MFAQAFLDPAEAARAAAAANPAGARPDTPGSPMVAGEEHAEKKRLAESVARFKNWKRWGPYLSERQW
jgi:hypothetical protein